jgi:hypothetical protein
MAQSLVYWPFHPGDGGQWMITNGYRGALDHALGGSPNNYAEFAFDFVRQSGTTTGAQVYAPVSGTVAWTDAKCRGLSLNIDAAPVYSVALFYVDGYPHSGHVNQGDLIGRVSSGGCIGVGNHIHMVLYQYTGVDAAGTRIGVPFSAQWAIGGCSYPDMSGSNLYQGQTVPCGATISGHVTDALTRRPVAGALMRFGDLSTGAPGDFPSADGNGFFSETISSGIGDRYLMSAGEINAEGCASRYRDHHAVTLMPAQPRWTSCCQA